jgi:hypothetical protein
VQKHLDLVFLHYLIPVLTIGLCILFLGGFEPRRLLARFAPPKPSAPAVAE